MGDSGAGTSGEAPAWMLSERGREIHPPSVTEMLGGVADLHGRPAATVACKGIDTKTESAAGLG